MSISVGDDVREIDDSPAEYSSSSSSSSVAPNAVTATLANSGMTSPLPSLTPAPIRAPFPMITLSPISTFCATMHPRSIQSRPTETLSKRYESETVVREPMCDSRPIVEVRKVVFEDKWVLGPISAGPMICVVLE